jgi:hypothetical protein|tara:strand:+ start:154 stop:432 length:279 start_codon:yes stop_codon:yes gene_type:complete
MAIKGTVCDMRTGVTTKYTWSTEDEAALLAKDFSEENWQNLRATRNEKLAETDYLALSDVVMSDEMRAYRQALRDLPANTTDPANPVWPVKP